MAVKTVVITSGSSWTVPGDFISLSAIHAIGGGVCGSPGFNGVVQAQLGNDWAQQPAGWKTGGAGYGGYYCTVTTATIAAGQVLALHVATASTTVSLSDWNDRYFGSPPLSDDTWLKTTSGSFIVYAPGGDSSESPIGDDIQGGDGGGAGGGSSGFASGNGGGAAGGPAGEPDDETGPGGDMGFGSAQYTPNGYIDPTQIKLFGAGGGNAAQTYTTGGGTAGSRTAAGDGNGDGAASAGGDGGIITGAAAASSSYLNPTTTSTHVTCGIIASTNFLFGSGDFTVEFWRQRPLFTTSQQGVYISVWDQGKNSKSWMAYVGQGASNEFGISWARSTNGTSSELVSTPVLNPRMITDSGAPLTTADAYNDTAWAHYAVMRQTSSLRFFVNGYPWPITDDGVHFFYTTPDSNTYYASTASLAIGCCLFNGSVSTSAAAGGSVNVTYPVPGWIGNVRISSSAVYSAATTSVYPTYLGQAFTPPTQPMLGGVFTCDWPGTKGAVSSTAVGATLTFVGTAQIDSDQYCYPPTVPETGGDGEDGFDGALWTSSADGSIVGPGGGGGGGGGDLARYRIFAGGEGGDGGLYGGGGGQGGGVNSGYYIGFGDADADDTQGQGGIGAAGVLVIQYNATAATESYNRVLG